MLKIKKKIIAIDFFCGAGGLTKGLIDAGIDVIFGIDNDISVKDTYEKNNDIPFICKDLNELSIKELRSLINKYTKEKEDYYLLFAGCAPCQPFSKINKSGTTKSDERLLLKFANFIKYLKPDFVFSENVPQIRKKEHVFKKFLNILEKEDYKPDYSIIDAKYYNVPQTRKRLVLIAAKNKTINLPASPNMVRTVRDAIEKLPHIEAGKKCEKVHNHQAAILKGDNIQRIKLTPKDGGDHRSWPDRFKLPCHKKSKGFTDVYGRMFWDKPAPTLTTKCISYSNGRYGHPEQDRAISLREAASLQSFPERYIFYGNQGTIAKHIGNAVPPALAKFFGEYFLENIELN